MTKFHQNAALAAVLLAAAAPASHAVEANLGHLAPTGDPRHEVMTAFADTVEEGTDGAVTIVSGLDPG